MMLWEAMVYVVFAFLVFLVSFCGLAQGLESKVAVSFPNNGSYLDCGGCREGVSSFSASKFLDRALGALLMMPLSHSAVKL